MLIQAENERRKDPEKWTIYSFRTVGPSDRVQEHEEGGVHGGLGPAPAPRVPRAAFPGGFRHRGVLEDSRGVLWPRRSAGAVVRHARLEFGLRQAAKLGEVDWKKKLRHLENC